MWPARSRPGRAATCGPTPARRPATPSSINKAILIGGIQVTITAVATDGSTITTNPAPPSGTGLAFHVITMCFRVQKWSLKKDWSVQLEGQTVTASMYDLDVGPKPVDVAPAPPSPIFYAIPAGPVWAPYQVQANASDALFPGEWTFDSDQVYVPLQDGGQQAYSGDHREAPGERVQRHGRGRAGHRAGGAGIDGRVAAGDGHAVRGHLRHRLKRAPLRAVEHRWSSALRSRAPTRLRCRTSRGRRSPGSLPSCCSSPARTT